MSKRVRNQYEAAQRAQMIVDRWMQGDITRVELAKEFNTTKGTLDQLFARLRKAGHQIPRKARGVNGGWIDPLPDVPIRIEPGDQWLGVQRMESESGQYKSETE